MRKRTTRIATIAAVLVAMSVTAGPPAKAEPLKSKTFRTPSENIGCGFYGGDLRCDILSGLKPEPKGQCEGDWTGLSVPVEGKAGPVCAGDTVYDSSSPILEYGKKWKRKGIVCRSRKSGLTCRNEGDHGFFLSRDSWDTF